MLFHDGLFHMFRNGFKQWPGKVSVGYLTSPDGLTWTEVQEEPVFTSDQVPYVATGEGADVSSVVVLDDGTWMMYFHRVSSGKPEVIGRAQADSPLGPWEVDPEPVLGPGERDDWDADGLSWPSVVQTEDGLVMYYSAQQSVLEPKKIGMATSTDGITWTKHDDPTTTEAPFGNSDPIYVSDQDWTSNGVDRARVVLSPEGWVMVFQGGGLIQRGLAFSPDGVSWTPHPDNPVIDREDLPFSATMWDTALVYHEDIYYYYTELGSMAGTDLYLAIHAGALKPTDLPEAEAPSSGAPLPEGVQVLRLDELLHSETSSIPVYAGHLSTSKLSLGVYALGPGARDGQSPHADDEVYYIIQGQGQLEVDGEKVPVAPGSLVYVRERVPHRFEEISADLQTLVFFSKGGAGEPPAPWQAFQVDQLLAEEISPEPLLDVPSMQVRLATLGTGANQPLPEAGSEEAIYLVLEGAGTALFGQASAALQAGSLLFTPAGSAPTFEVPAGGLQLLVFTARG